MKIFLEDCEWRQVRRCGERGDFGGRKYSCEKFGVLRPAGVRVCFMRGTMDHASVLCVTRLRFTSAKALFFNASPNTKTYVCFNQPPCVDHFQYGARCASSAQ
jgi:hypothetical protein